MKYFFQFDSYDEILEFSENMLEFSKHRKSAEPIKAAEPEPEPEPEITLDAVRNIFSKLMEADKSEEAKELAKKYGAIKVMKIKPEHFAAVIADAKVLLE